MIKMHIVHKQLIIAIFGLCVLLVSFPISQISDDFEVLSESATVDVNNENLDSTVASIFLKLDDYIEVFVDQNSSDTLSSVSVSFLGRPSVSSIVSVNPHLVWVCNGNQNYTIDVQCNEFFNSQVISFNIDYVVTRGYYPFIWLFPVGLIIGCLTILFAIDFKKIFGNINHQSLSVTKLTKLFQEKFLANNIVQKLRRVDFIVLFLFLLFISVSFLLDSPILHNDEIGGGKIDNWGYYAWGYVDTNNQIVDLVTDCDFSYDSWHSLQTMNKSPFAHYFMALFVIVFSDLSPLLASRLFVQFVSTVTPVVVYFLVKMIFDRKSGVFAAFLLFFNPIYLHYSRSSYLEVPVLFFLSLFLLMLYKTAVTGASFKYSILTGLTLGLVLSTKSFLFIYLLIPIVFVWLLYMSPEKTMTVKKAIVISSKIGFLAVVIFFLLWPAIWVNPFLKLVFQGAFFGLFGSYGPLFSVINPTLFFGSIVSPLPLISGLTMLFYQTTYIELFGFVLGLAYLLYNIKLKTSRVLLVFLGFNLVSLAFLFAYQHHLLYFILAFAVVSAIGFGFIVNSLTCKLKQKLNVPRKVLNSTILLLIIGCQLLLISPSSPNFGLYYNDLFFGEQIPTEVFELPEPVYGLDQVANYINNNPSSSNIILTTNSPHVLQTYLPDYEIKSTYGFGFDKNDAKTLLILRSMGIEYVVIGESAIQINPNMPLKSTLDNYAEITVFHGNNVNFSYLYKIPEISWNRTIWENSVQTAVDWKNNSNTDSYFNISSTGQLLINLNFNSSYPPSLWFKIYQSFDVPLNLSNTSLYLVLSSSSDSNSTISITLLDQDRNYFETVLKAVDLVDVETTVLFTKMSDLDGVSCIDFSKITYIDLTFYNEEKTSETIILQNFALVS